MLQVFSSIKSIGVRSSWARAAPTVLRPARCIESCRVSARNRPGGWSQSCWSEDMVNMQHLNTPPVTRSCEPYSIPPVLHYSFTGDESRSASPMISWARPVAPCPAYCGGRSIQRRNWGVWMRAPRQGEKRAKLLDTPTSLAWDAVICRDTRRFAQPGGTRRDTHVEILASRTASARSSSWGAT